jgi:tetraacyldisaccharide 4'-kinase
MPMFLIKILVYPLALLYAFIVMLRNKLFDWKILRSKKFSIPVISVGNLSYGGTGKTPQIEFLIRLFQEQFNICVLSRGYGRSSRGFILAGENHTAADIGDEPLQYFRKFKDITVAVDERRSRGITQVLKMKPETNLVLLDDAFQHRYVKPALSILLTDFHHLYMNDYPLPTGTLREFRSGARRADVIIVTKTPRIFSPILRREIAGQINPARHQKVFYSYIDYMDPVPLRVTGIEKNPASKYSYVLMLSGIANSYPLQDYLRNLCNELVVRDFPDHHKYTLQDVRSILDSYNNILSKDKVIFTTEKDAMRLEQEEFSELLAGLPVYYIPIRVKFHHCDDARFDKFIHSYVERNK